MTKKKADDKGPEELPENEKIPADEAGAAAKPIVPEDDGKAWEHASSQIWGPEIGDVLQGIFDGSEPFTEGTLETEVNKYFVVTTDGRRYSFVGGAVFDKAFQSADIKPGMEVRITYLGKKDLKKEGRRVNLFEIKYRSVK